MLSCTPAKLNLRMARLIVDARLAGHSGIGVYLAQVLPRVLPRLASWRPLVLAAPGGADAVSAMARDHAEVAVWRVPPLGVTAGAEFTAV